MAADDGGQPGEADPVEDASQLPEADTDVEQAGPEEEPELVSFRDNLRDQFRSDLLVYDLPILEPRGKQPLERPLNPDVIVCRANPDDEDELWTKLHQTFTGAGHDESGNREDGRSDNLKPWFRCIGVVRGLDVKTIVIERYYVCLDHKSEHASFYSHIDELRDPTTVRIHFFGADIPEERITELDPDTDIPTYRGYIVCRRGNLPLVGRAMISVPSYVVEHASVEETVNFLGQQLAVTGVPFMQQDARFAVCADVAIWTLAYTAYRRGISERRVIADVVELSGASKSLRPRLPVGLTPTDTSRVLTALGFNTKVMSIPGLYWVGDLPDLSIDDLPKTTADRVRKLLKAPTATGSLNTLLWPPLQQVAQEVDDSYRRGKPKPDLPSDDRIRALEVVLDELLAGYIQSRMPIYMSTKTHALVLCGRTPGEDGTRLFVHDDQNGPYLAVDGLSFITSKSLSDQSGRLLLPESDAEAMNSAPRKRRKAEDEQATEDEESGSIFEPHPPKDRLLTWGDRPLGPGGAECDQAVGAIVIPTPARAMHSPWLATAHAVLWEQNIKWIKGVPVPKTDHVRYVVTMGIDYKSKRREECVKLGDTNGTQTFSALHLPEWVVVVEGISDNKVIWENVYDASSGVLPRLMFARVLRLGLVAPIGIRTPGSSDLDVQLVGVNQITFSPLSIPPKVGKVAVPQQPAHPD